MIFIRFILGTLAILVTGYALLRAVLPAKRQLSFIEMAVLSFGLGAGFVGLEIFGLSLFFRQLNLLLLLLPQILLLVWAMFRFRGNLFYHFDLGRKISFSLPEALLAIAIIWEIAYISGVALSLPFTAWDAWGGWGFRAKIFFIEKNALPIKLWTQLPWINHPNHLDYPLLIPFVECYNYFFLGQVHEPLMRLFCSFYYAGSIGLFYIHLKRQFAAKFALGSCLVLATIPNFLNMAHTGYMDVPLLFYLFGGVLYTLRYLREREEGFLWLAAIFLGIGCWVKNEGFTFYLALFLSGLIICRQNKAAGLEIDKKRFLATLLIIPLLIYLPWILFKHSVGVGAKYYIGSPANFFNSAFARLPQVVKLWLNNSWDPRAWNILWIAFTLSLLWFIVRPKGRFSVFMLLIILFQIFFYFTVYILYVTTPTLDIDTVVRQTVDRLLLHLAPVALLFICTQLGEKWKIS